VNAKQCIQDTFAKFYYEIHEGTDPHDDDDDDDHHHDDNDDDHDDHPKPKPKPKPKHHDNDDSDDFAGLALVFAAGLALL
jgi:hypothetical protein